MTKVERITCVATSLIILGGISLFIAWLADKMKSPTFYIDKAEVNAYNFSTTNHLNATFTFVVGSHNRDPKYKIKYHNVAVSVYHTNGFSLGYEALGPYIQDHGDELVFTAQPLVRDEFVSDSSVAEAIRGEIKEGELKVEVRVRGAIRYEVKGWKHRHYNLKVICNPVVINLTSRKTSQRIICDVTRF